MKKRIVFWTLTLIMSIVPLCANAQVSYKVTAQRVNIRSNPSTQSSIVGVLRRDEVISVIGIQNGWASFLINGKVRYVSANYLSLVKKEIPTRKDYISPQTAPEPTPKPTPQAEQSKVLFSKSNDGHISLFADIYGGYSNFRCAQVSPKAGVGFGVDAGIMCDYNRFFSFMPQGLYGEFSLGYSCSGSGAYPLHGIGFRFLPAGYRYSLDNSLSIVGKLGIYVHFPFSSFSTPSRIFDSNVDCGLSLAAGVEWNEFGLMVSYEHGFINVVDKASVELYNQGAFLTLSYKFLTFK